MGEFASKGLAGTALGLAIPGTVALAGQLLNGSGIFGGWGNNCGNRGWGWNNNNCGVGWGVDQVSALQAEVGMLRAEKYSDRNTADVYSAVRSEYKDLLEKWITPLSDEACRNRERIAVLETSVKYENEKALLREDNIRLGLKGYIDECCCQTNGRISELQDRVAGMGRTLNSITATVIPRTAICPEVMPRYNSWIAPTEEAPATQPITGSVAVSRAAR